MIHFSGLYLSSASASGRGSPAKSIGAVGPQKAVPVHARHAQCKETKSLHVPGIQGKFFLNFIGFRNCVNFRDLYAFLYESKTIKISNFLISFKKG